MNSLQIRKAGLEAAVRLVGGGLVAGRFFIDDRGDSPLDALLSLLNDQRRSFLPFAHASESGVRLLSRSHIEVVWPTGGVSSASIAGSAVVEQATIDYGDGAITGDAFVGDMHPDQRRLLDLLNDARPFFIIRSEERTYLVHKARVRSAFAPGRSSRSAA